MKLPMFVAGILIFLCQQGGTMPTAGMTEATTEGPGWLDEGDVLDMEERLMNNGEDFAISLSFNGETMLYTGKKLKLGMEQTPGEGVEAVDFDDCVRTSFNKKGELMQLYDGCTYFSGGILETDKGFFELDIGESGNKKTGTLKKVQRSEELQKKIQDSEPKINPEYEKWLEENKGSIAGEKREASNETHLIELGVLGDFTFYERMGKDAKKIGEFLTIALQLIATGLEKLPNTKVKVTSNTYYKANPSWMENANLSSGAYLDQMNKHALAAAGVDQKKVDVWVYVTGKNFMGGTLGWAYLGDACWGVSGSVNEIGNGGDVGSKQDAWALADIAAHEVGHSIGFNHDFMNDTSRSPHTCHTLSTRGQMHYNSLDWLKKRLEAGGKVWSACSLSNWANFLKAIKAKGKYCFGAEPQPTTTTTPVPLPPKGKCGNCETFDQNRKGCSVSTIQTCVCNFDKYCCEGGWDKLCVIYVSSECKVSCK